MSLTDDLIALIEALSIHSRNEKQHLHAESLADAIWLASSMSETALSTNPAKGPTEQPDRTAAKVEQPTVLGAAKEGPDRPGADLEAFEAPRFNEKPRRIEADNSQTPSNSSSDIAVPVRTLKWNAPDRFPPLLGIARSLRPFKRPWTEGVGSTVDLDKTIDNYGMTGRLVPALKPRHERWFDLNVVIEDATSMAPWGERISKFVRLLDTVGAFRSVRTWKLRSREGSFSLVDRAGRITSPQQLMFPRGRVLTIVVSDYTHSAWNNDGSWAIIHDLSLKGSLALVNVLPSRLWRYSALDIPAGKAVAPRPGASNDSLSLRSPMRVKNPVALVPTLGLTAWSVQRWSTALMDGDARGCEVLCISQPVTRRQTLDENAYDAPTGKERVAAFLFTATPAAARLAVICSSLPSVPLSVLELVQSEFVPKSAPEDVAEVLVSGLFELEASDASSELVFAFRPGVQSSLAKHLSSLDAWQLTNSLIEHAESLSGSSREVQAAIYDTAGSESLDATPRTFVDASKSVLEAMGWTPAEIDRSNSISVSPEALGSGLTADPDTDVAQRIGIEHWIAPSVDWHSPPRPSASRHHASHQQLWTEVRPPPHFSVEDAQEEQLDLIVVPTSRSLNGDRPGLRLALEVADKFSAQIVVVCSKDAKVDDFPWRTARTMGLTADRHLKPIVMDFDSASRALPLSSSAQSPIARLRRPVDTSPKRNLALAIAHEWGAKNILFLDDDITPVTSGPTLSRLSLGYALNQLRISDTMRAVGFTASNQSNDSVVCQIRRLAGYDQKVFLSASALLVKLTGTVPHFPVSMYKEDWYFMMYMCAGAENYRESLGWGGDIHQSASTILTSERAWSEEAGDLIGEALMNLFEDHGSAFLEFADHAFWQKAIRARLDMLSSLRAQLRTIPPDHRDFAALEALRTATNAYSIIKANDIVAYLAAVANDQREWSALFAWPP